MALLAIQDVVVRFGGVVALDGPSFEVGSGEICGLIGPNGAGKTTLFNCVSRLQTPSAGRIELEGEDLLGGFESGIEGSGVKVVKKESYNVTDPTVAAQVGRLARSGADTFLNITTPKFSAQAIAAVAKSDWKPLHILNNVGASKALVLKPVGLKNAKGIVSTAYFKDPEDPQWADDPAMTEYKAAIKKYAPRANPEEQLSMYGWAVAQTMGKALEQMKEPTRASLMETVRSLDLEQGTLLPGEKVQTGPDDGYPLEAMQIIRFDGENWKLQGDLVEAKAG